MAVRLKGRNKYKMYRAMRKNKSLRSSLPETRMFNSKNFQHMVKKYKTVVIKPNNGKQGKRIYFVTNRNGKYYVHLNKKYKVFSSRNSTYRYIRKASKKKRFIIQQEISLAKIKKRRFDFRIIVQRKCRKDPWVVNGIIVRQAGRGFKVTNRKNNGRVLSVDRALSQINIKNKSAKIMEVKRLSLEAAKTLGTSFPGQRIFGVDIGMDPKDNLYIFELNRWPLLGGFRSLKDKTQYKRIMYFKRVSRKKK
ncbi:YheC/YheD family protein [Thalassorhabdus alkalitolerans]|uniref:YheC/YheD family protein n=1 Tax=Thalassorhabdus alkalitolerans TaxID=2282697 RepID=A0ABW0YKA0_9BACI